MYGDIWINRATNHFTQIMIKTCSGYSKRSAAFYTTHQGITLVKRSRIWKDDYFISFRTAAKCDTTRPRRLGQTRWHLRKSQGFGTRITTPGLYLRKPKSLCKQNFVSGKNPTFGLLGLKPEISFGAVNLNKTSLFSQFLTGTPLRGPHFYRSSLSSTILILLYVQRLPLWRQWES